MTDTAAEAHTAIVEDHDYEPKDPSQPWGLCRHCNLQEAAHVRTRRSYRVTSLPAPPTNLPPNARPVDLGGSGDPEEDPPIGVTAEGMGSAEYAEHAVEPERCWKCGTKDGVRQLPTNGAYLCAQCEQMLKP